MNSFPPLQPVFDSNFLSWRISLTKCRALRTSLKRSTETFFFITCDSFHSGAFTFSNSILKNELLVGIQSIRRDRETAEERNLNTIEVVVQLVQRRILRKSLRASFRNPNLGMMFEKLLLWFLSGQISIFKKHMMRRYWNLVEVLEVKLCNDQQFRKIWGKAGSLSTWILILLERIISILPICLQLGGQSRFSIFSLSYTNPPYTDSVSTSFQQCDIGFLRRTYIMNCMVIPFDDNRIVGI